MPRRRYRLRLADGSEHDVTTDELRALALGDEVGPLTPVLVEGEWTDLAAIAVLVRYEYPRRAFFGLVALGLLLAPLIHLPAHLMTGHLHPAWAAFSLAELAVAVLIVCGATAAPFIWLALRVRQGLARATGLGDPLLPALAAGKSFAAHFAALARTDGAEQRLYRAAYGAAGLWLLAGTTAVHWTIMTMAVDDPAGILGLSTPIVFFGGEPVVFLGVVLAYWAGLAMARLTAR